MSKNSSAQNFNHILFIDPLEKLSLKKDSSLQLALALKEKGRQVALLFEEDFFFSNDERPKLKLYKFSGSFEEGSPYIKDFSRGEAHYHEITERDVLHMRIDPPFDSRYLRYLWILKGLQKKWGLRVLNDPAGIAVHNEKMVSYEEENAVETYVGSSLAGFETFYKNLKSSSKFSGLILKPLDLFQGIGVEKVEANTSDEEVLNLFDKKRVEYGGPVVAQPFLSEVHKGELRSLYFNGIELGTIIKIPPEGQFLANIAQGAHYEAVKLDDDVAKACKKMSIEFSKKGVPWLAFDILGGKIQEANLTCPGLLVEVSKGMKKNLAYELVDLMEDYLTKN